MSDENILTLTADIVSAHLIHNSVSATDLPELIQTVYASLDSLGKPEPVVEAKAEPAVSIRSSVKADAITCLECGTRLKMLKRHLQTHHQSTPAEYKARWGLSLDYPLVAPDYAARRSQLARDIGLGRNPESAPGSAATGAPAATADVQDNDPAPQARPGRRPRAKVATFAAA